MSRIKTIVASGIFLLLTVMKFAFPALAGEMRRVILPQIEYDTDYRAAFKMVGEKITGEDGVIAVIGQMYDGVNPFSSSASPEPTVTKTPESASQLENLKKPTSLTDQIQAQMQSNAEKDAPERLYVSPTPEIVVTENPSPQAEDSASTQEPPPQQTPELPAPVAKFLDAQAIYGDVTIPENVDVSMPSLSFSYATPVAGYKSSGFGFRLHPIENEVKFHFGTDFAASTGTEITAFAAGTVIAAEEIESYGKYVMIDHGNGYVTLYAHCSEIGVESGESITQGQYIGRVGETGQATGPHLHFELMHQGIYLNPEYYISEN